MTTDDTYINNQHAGLLSDSNSRLSNARLSRIIEPSRKA